MPSTLAGGATTPEEGDSARARCQLNNGEDASASTAK